MKSPDQTGKPDPLCRAAACTMLYGYDARERLTSWDDGHGAQTAYSLDAETAAVDSLEGNVTREAVTGTGQATRELAYNAAGQLRTLTVDGTLQERSFYDAKAGTLRCVTGAAGTAADCDPDPSTGAVSPSLRDKYSFDPLERLEAFKSYRSNNTADSSYTYDAFDRVSWQTESHNGGTARRTDLAYLGPTDAVSSETHTGGTAAQLQELQPRRRPATRRHELHVSRHDQLLQLRPQRARRRLPADQGRRQRHRLLRLQALRRRRRSRLPRRQPDPLNAYRFNDRRLDSGSGSIDMGARRFGPDLGRFLSQDYYRGALDDLELSSDPLTQGRYGFAGGNPVSFVRAGRRRSRLGQCAGMTPDRTG